VTNPLALIVEDDEDLTVIFTKALEAAGHVTEVEMDGGQAWSRLETICPALVVLDLHLPNLSGLDILRRMRAKDCLTHTIILAVSADARMADLASADADLVLIKPITFSQLRDLSSRFVPVESLPVDAAAQPGGAEAPAHDAAAQPGDTEAPAHDVAAQPGEAEAPAHDAAAQPGDTEAPAHDAEALLPENAESPPLDAETSVDDAEGPPGNQEKPPRGSSRAKARSGQAERRDRIV
jgi:CheY-like chemotaxis protein